MTNYLSEFTKDLFEFQRNSEIIDLEPEQPEKALDISQKFQNVNRRWQVYCQALALFAFEEWLHQREPNLHINKEQSSLARLYYANVIDAVCHLRIGEFKVCLIPKTLLVDEEVTIPRAVIDLPEFAAHFYVVLGLEEELELATIQGFLNYNELMYYQSEFLVEVDWNYHLPLSYFHHESDDLLLYLQSLVSTAIPLPEIPQNRQATLATLQATLLDLLTQAHQRPLWKVLSWEQGVAVLTNEDLLYWLYNSLTKDTAFLNKHLSDLLKILTEKTINVRSWLNNQIDEVAQALSWQVLPPLTAIRTIESPLVQELRTVLAEIKRTHQFDLPDFAGRAYRDIPLQSRLRLYAVSWSLPNEENEWALLLILKVIPGHQLPYAVKLRVSDQKDILVEEELQPSSSQDYIFTCVEGSCEDKFLATITTADGEEQSLPPFEFYRAQK
ncbi:DUF1822 family protein [Scytonema sp. UIC 10036]|uniref:DUF1822 family protein n=1 Tax=Scytonema sp. UIC 10036 TaxID=2304196 RepID=UPI0012DA0BA4|nr:DUF1822 family protein [Scytonema sp. UIC 10036]MUG91337.1 DUF1822 family protein [Scytonema sp. UIC 10036]